MDTKKILDRDNKPTSELQRTVTKKYKGITLSYTEVYYLDYDVDEESGMINRDRKVEFYTKDQVERNLTSLKNSYMIAMGSASPKEIIEFRTKYHIPASILSKILGFSKNTISNIENHGMTSLSTGRLIKMCIQDRKTLRRFVEICDDIDINKKKELSISLSQ